MSQKQTQKSGGGLLAVPGGTTGASSAPTSPLSSPLATPRPSVSIPVSEPSSPIRTHNVVRRC